MPTEAYPRVAYGGRTYWQIPTLTLVDIDPEGGSLFFVGVPEGGVGAFGPLVKGDPGFTPLLQEEADVEELEHDDPTPVSSQWVMVSPGNSVTPPTYKEVKTVRKPAPGQDGNTVLEPADFTGVVAGRVIAVNAAADGFELAPQRVAGLRWPANVTEAPAGTTTSATIATISVLANAIPFAWQPQVSGLTVITGSSADLRCDLIARLNGIGGTVVGRCPGVSGASDRPILQAGPDAGTASNDVTIAANAAATLYLRVEKQTGFATFQTSGTRFSFEAVGV